MALKLKRNEIMTSETSEYVLLSFLGSGAFGKVVKCRKINTGEILAVKVLRNNNSPAAAARELDILNEVTNNTDSHQHNIIRYFESFYHGEHLCMVFEALERSLQNFIEKKTNYEKPFDMTNVRAIAFQIFTALEWLRTLDIYHADLKPDNIMLVDSLATPLRVKLIDFGSAKHISQIKHNSPRIQTTHYRAPEILLGLPFNEALDLWSFGCVLAEVFTGKDLYAGYSEYDMIRLITESRGVTPSNMLSEATKKHLFYVCEEEEQEQKEDTKQTVWRLKFPHELEEKTNEINTGLVLNKNTLRYITESNVSENLSDTDLVAELRDRKQFLSLLNSLLTVDQKCRITAKEGLRHPFITLIHRM